MDSSNIELFDVGKKSANPRIPSVPKILKVSIGRNRRYPRNSSIPTFPSVPNLSSYTILPAF
jgi:hypothetical protein